MASQALTQVNDSNLDQVILADPSPIMVEFFAPWCPHCRRMAPIIEALAQDYAGRVRVAQFNVEGNMESPVRLDVRGVPTMIFLVNGQPVDRLVGEANKEALAAHFERVLAGQPQPG